MDHPSGHLNPRRGPPRRAETLPVRFAGIGPAGRTVRREGEPSIERELDVIVEPTSRRQTSQLEETPRTRAVPIETDRHLSPPTGRRYREQRGMQRSEQRKRQRSGRSRRHDRDDTHAKRSEFSKSMADSSESTSAINESWDSSDTSVYERIRPPRPGLRHTTVRYYDSESDTDDDSDVNRDAYAFSLPRYSRSPLSQDATLIGSDPSITSESQAAANGLKQGMAHNVYHSQYTGEGVPGKVQSAQLTVIHDPKRGRSPLFRWM
jgi:hypothetical protein